MDGRNYRWTAAWYISTRERLWSLNGCPNSNSMIFWRSSATTRSTGRKTPAFTGAKVKKIARVINMAHQKRNSFNDADAQAHMLSPKPVRQTSPSETALEIRAKIWAHRNFKPRSACQNLNSFEWGMTFKKIRRHQNLVQEQNLTNANRVYDKSSSKINRSIKNYGNF